MKNLIYILLALLILTACDDSDPTNPTPEPELCPAPVERPGIGYHRPLAHSLQDASINLELLAYKNSGNILKVLNLKTGNLKSLELEEYLPNTVKLTSIERLHWSPYDNRRIFIQAVTLTDTAGGGFEYINGWNLYIFDIENMELNRITPSEWGNAGIEGPLNISSWMPQSREGRDIFSLDRVSVGSGAGFYIAQEDSTISTMSMGGPRDFYISNDGKYSIAWNFYDHSNQYYSLNIYSGSSLLPTEYYMFTYIDLYKANKISWSPQNQYITISGLASDWYDKTPAHRRYYEIWLVDFDSLLKRALTRTSVNVSPLKIINLRREFCMYSITNGDIYGQMGTEFISDTTMAVSMHEDGAEYSYLYEISIHGEMIRQLTFEP